MPDHISLMLESMIMAVDEGFSFDGIVSIPEIGLEDAGYRTGLGGLFKNLFWSKRRRPYNPVPPTNDNPEVSPSPPHGPVRSTGSDSGSIDSGIAPGGKRSPVVEESKSQDDVPPQPDPQSGTESSRPVSEKSPRLETEQAPDVSEVLPRLKIERAPDVGEVLPRLKTERAPDVGEILPRLKAERAPESAGHGEKDLSKEPKVVNHPSHSDANPISLVPKDEEPIHPVDIGQATTQEESLPQLVDRLPRIMEAKSKDDPRGSASKEGKQPRRT